MQSFIQDANPQNLPAALELSDLGIRDIKFGTDEDPDAEYLPFPTQINLMASIDFISYDAVLQCLTDENVFFQLQSTDDIIADGQRSTKRIPDPFVDDREVNAISVSLPGILTPDTLLALLQGATKAGHHMLTPERRGVGCCEFTIFTLIPNYVVV